MIHLLIIMYTFVISLHPVIKLGAWAALDTNWRNSLAGVRPTAATAFGDDEDFDTWQPVVQSQNWVITSASTAPSSVTATQGRESERFSLMFQRQQQHQQYLPNHYYAYNHHNGNYTKKEMDPLSSASSSNQSAPKTATIKLKPYVATSIDTNIHDNSNYRRYNPNKHFPFVEHHPYTPHISQDTDSASQVERRVDASKHYKADVNRQSHLPYQDNHRISPAMLDSRLSHIPAATTTTTTTKDTFTVTNVNLIDTAATAFKRDDDADINEILLPLHAALDKVKEFCDIVKDIITDDKDDGNNNGGGAGAADDAADDEDLSKEDGNDDNDLTNSNFAPVLAALMMKTPMTTSFLSPKPVDEVQGHAQEIDKGRQKDSLASTPSSTSLPPSSPASPSLLPLSASSSSSEPVTSRAFTVHKTSLRAAASQSPRMRIPKIGSKRKIKRKIKKKFKKFLFPLLVAYKLKFLALIPLLIGGLTLLVGSTGLAGFFFALFAAVMTMKSGRGRSIVVTKLN